MDASASSLGPPHCHQIRKGSAVLSVSSLHGTPPALLLGCSSCFAPSFRFPPPVRMSLRRPWPAGASARTAGCADIERSRLTRTSSCDYCSQSVPRKPPSVATFQLLRVGYLHTHISIGGVSGARTETGDEHVADTRCGCASPSFARHPIVRAQFSHSHPRWNSRKGNFPLAQPSVFAEGGRRP